MEVKFERRMNEYNYILSFDIAKHKSGFALIDIVHNKLAWYGLVVTDPNSLMPWLEFYDKMYDTIESVRKNFGESFFVIKERLPNQGGPRSSIAALQELAKAHAVFDLVVAKINVDFYDQDGVAAVSEKAYYKNKYGIEKPSKEDIFNCIKQEFPELEKYEAKDYTNPEWSLDISDAIAVVQTLRFRKWDADIDLEIREQKKALKKLKRARDIKEREAHISYLQSLKNERE